MEESREQGAEARRQVAIVVSEQRVDFWKNISEQRGLPGETG